MTGSRDTATKITPGGRTLAARLLLCAVLATLAACAEGNSTASVAPTAATAPTASAAPAPAATAAAAPAAAAPAAPAPKPAKPPPPEKLTATEINEKCWMDPEINKVRDLDKRLKLVDKCVDQKTKAQGGL